MYAMGNLRFSGTKQAASAACVACQVGTFASVKGSLYCMSCTAGKYALNTASTCSLCKPGTYSASNNSMLCFACGSGGFASGLGTTRCENCASGTYSSPVDTETKLTCSSNQNNSLCMLNNKCAQLGCAQGTVGRYLPGEAYDNNEEMTIIIAAPADSLITLTFFWFMVEHNYDFVQIYSCKNETCQNPILISSFSGYSVPAAQYSSTGVMQIVWTSDVCCPKPSSSCRCTTPIRATQLYGWAAYYSVEGATTCYNCSVGSLGQECSQKVRKSNMYLSTALFRADRLLSKITDAPFKNEVQARTSSAFGASSARRSKYTENQNSFETRSRRQIQKQVLFRGLYPIQFFKKTTGSFKDHRCNGNCDSSIFLSTASIHKQAENSKDVSGSPIAHYLGVRRQSSNLSASNVPSNLSRRFSMCDESNFAAYGPCIGSTYQSLQILESPTEGNPAFPGIEFSVTVRKVDAYKNTIVTDSSSLLEVFVATGQGSNMSAVLNGNSIARMQVGLAHFSFAIIPRFEKVSFAESMTVLSGKPYVYFGGTDAEALQNLAGISYVAMLSETLEISLHSGDHICPLGYVLILDSANAGVCTQCKAGTYSVSPLKGESSQIPSCLECPAGGNCELGGENVSFALGEWIVDDGIFKLVGCPRGCQLVNKNTFGLFAQESQICTVCAANEYILNSDDADMSCNRCPIGAVCNGSWLHGLVNRSVWLPDNRTGLFVLTKCPEVD